jgi:hypothetical protein
LEHDEHDLVFCRPDGTSLRPDRVTAEFERHVRACDLPVIRLHDTRHGACSLMLAGDVRHGASVWKLAPLLAR